MEEPSHCYLRSGSELSPTVTQYNGGEVSQTLHEGAATETGTKAKNPWFPDSSELWVGSRVTLPTVAFGM